MGKDYMTMVTAKKTIKPTDWFLTDIGRKCSNVLITGIAIALPLTRFVPHTLLLYKYKEWVHNYKNGKPVQLTQEIQDRVTKCLELLKMEEKHRQLIQPFNVVGFDLFNAGSTSFRHGVAIGIPSHFTYSSLSDVQKFHVEVNDKSVDINSEYGKKFAETLILTDTAQEFAICREILMTHNHKVFFETCHIFLGVYLVHTFSYNINRLFKLHNAHAAVRGVVYTFASLLGLGFYFLIKDATQRYYENEVDKKLAQLDPDHVRSGVEFYEKLMNRNIALSEIMKVEKKKSFMEIGTKLFFRQPHVPVEERKRFLEESLKKYDT